MRAHSHHAAPAASRTAPGRPVELTDDPAFARRIVRLALTSCVALGLIWWLTVVTLDIHPVIDLSLAAGWVLMPSLLMLSLRRPLLRYALVVPSSLVGVPLLVIAASGVAEGVVATVGWQILTAGILLGGALGIWFWFRWLPVPGWLHDPFSPHRWLLVALHVGLVLGGLTLVGIAAVR